MIKKMIIAAAVVMLGLVPFVGATPVFANAFNEQACGSLDGDEAEAAGCNTSQTAPVVATNIFQIIISLLGIIAVLMIVVAGQRYITSNGEPEKIKQARNMIVYSLIGLIIAILAFAIVTFVQNSITQ